MKNKIKYLSIIFLIVCTFLCTVNVFALPEGNEDTTSSTPLATESAPTSSESVVTEPTTPSTTQPTTAPLQTTAPSSTNATVATKATTKATKPSTAPSSTTSPTVSSTAPSSTRSYTQSYSANSTTAPNGALYDTGERIDEDVLQDEDWNEIKDQLLNNDEKNESDDFGFIRKNDKDGDNGLWILIVGILLIILGVGIIGLWVFLAIRKNKILEEQKKNRKGDKRPQRRTPSRADNRRRNRMSKYDTGEVDIRRKRSSTQQRRSNNTRYRPKH